MIASLVLSDLLFQEVVVGAVEARAASPWAETFTASCGDNRLELRRVMRPEGRAPEVLLNGAAPRGDVDALADELGGVGAAYRFSFQCQPGDDAILLRWVRGLADGTGSVAFRSGSATFDDGAVTAVRSEAGDANSFWYR
ncbi:hypothetical protein [Brevundimonas kwangchunensis]